MGPTVMKAPMKFLKSLFLPPREVRCEFGQPAPLIPLAAIGDIHGCADLLERLLSQLEPDLQVICVGDYIDRGDHSADVLHILHANADIICLKGNHEEMLLNFLEQPETYGRRWFRNGGLQTMASFGIAGLTETGHGLKPAIAEPASAIGFRLFEEVQQHFLVVALEADDVGVGMQNVQHVGRMVTTINVVADADHLQVGLELRQQTFEQVGAAMDISNGRERNQGSRLAKLATHLAWR